MWKIFFWLEEDLRNNKPRERKKIVDTEEECNEFLNELDKQYGDSYVFDTEPIDPTPSYKSDNNERSKPGSSS